MSFYIQCVAINDDVTYDVSAIIDSSMLYHYSLFG